LKLEAKTAGLTAETRNPKLCGNFGFCRSMLLASLLLAFAFSTSGEAQPAPTSPGIVSSSRIPVIGRLVSGNEEKQPAQDNDNSSDSTSDLDDNEGSSDDVTAVTFTHHDDLFSSFRLHPSSFSLGRSPGTVPVFLLPTQSLSCLCDRIRERAPPIPVSHRSQA
jgi:hypothetical protein